MDQISVGQLHWSTANYQPLQERVLWDGLASMYEEVGASEPWLEDFSCIPFHATCKFIVRMDLDGSRILLLDVLHICV